MRHAPFPLFPIIGLSPSYDGIGELPLIIFPDQKSDEMNPLPPPPDPPLFPQYPAAAPPPPPP